MSSLFEIPGNLLHVGYFVLPAPCSPKSPHVFCIFLMNPSIVFQFRKSFWVWILSHNVPPNFNFFVSHLRFDFLCGLFLRLLLYPTFVIPFLKTFKFLGFDYLVIFEKIKVEILRAHPGPQNANKEIKCLGLFHPQPCLGFCPGYNFHLLSLCISRWFGPNRSEIVRPPHTLVRLIDEDLLPFPNSW